MGSQKELISWKIFIMTASENIFQLLQKIYGLNFNPCFFTIENGISKRIDKLEKNYNDCMRKYFPTSPKNLRAEIQSLFFHH
jgi:hypothetical protein